MEKKLLDLIVEYTNYDDTKTTFASVGLKPDRTKEDIAVEYGETLRAFLASD